MTKARPLTAIGADENIDGGTTLLGRARKEPRHYLLIGSGRLAKHLQFYFSLLSNEHCNFTLQTWDRHQDPHALNLKLSKATHVLLAIKDSALASFFELHIQGLDLVCVHFSAATRVGGTYSAHPLMTFTEQLYTPELYRNIPFVLRSDLEAENKLQDGLQEIIPDLPNSSYVIDSKDAAKYHALCVMAGNFPQILWKKVANEFSALNIPVEAMHLYLRQVLENFIRHPDSALTGPLVRDDQKTIRANLESLQNDEFQIVYQSFVQAYAKFKTPPAGSPSAVTTITSEQGNYRDEANSI